jgi:hypothetical protein
MTALSRLGGILGFMLSIGLIYLQPAVGFEVRTHRAITQEAVESSSVDHFLRDHLGIDEGIRSPLGGIEIRDWVSIGSEREDDFTIIPAGRFLNHFHHPLRAWNGAGLTDLVPLQTSAVVWAQLRNQPAVGTGSWSWQETRDRFRLAMTSIQKEDRNRMLADTFRGLGHQIHLSQDAASVPHARNESHATGFSFERWTLDRFQRTRPGEFTQLLAQTPRILPDQRLFSKLPDPLAPIPISRLIDADEYTGENPAATAALEDGTDISGQPVRLSPVGLAEYTNANFLHRDTIFTDNLPRDHKWWSPYPRQSSTNLTSLSVPQEVRAEDAQIDRVLYVKKERDGERIEHFLKPTYAMTFANEVGRPTNFRLQFQLDDKVYEDYARLLLPRAVGYSIGLLDYFFRGKLDVDVVEADPSDPSQLQLTGTNASTEVLRDGNLSVYADDPTGVRNLVTSVPVTQVEPNTSIPAVPFQAPEDAERFVAVYQGTLGQETRDDSRNIPGAVIGKVLGGVRVEEVFSDGTRWHLRTPLGVFPLPISGREIVELRWGDRDNTLVGRTLFGRGEPNQFFAYEIARPAGSSDVPLLTGPDGSQQVNVTVLKQVPFPYGIDLGTTVEFAQTIHYTQYLFSFVRTITQVADCPNCSYRVTEQTVSDGRINLMVDETRTVTRSFPLRLDRESQFCCGATYSWFLRDVGFTATGQVLALVSVALRNPLDQVTFPAFTLDLNPGSPVPERREFPPVAVPLTIPSDIAPALWALVDVGTGTVVASTAPATLTISQTTPFAFFLSHPFFLDTLARVFLKERFVGGSLDGFSRDVATDLLAKTCPEADQTGGPPLAEVTFEGKGLEAAVSQYRPEIAQAQFPPSLEDLPPFVSQFTFLCPSTDAGLSARLQVTANGRSFRSSRLAEVRRTEPRAGAEQLVLLVAKREASEDSFPPDQARLVTWIPDAARAEVRHQLLPGFHRIESVSSSAATVFSQPLGTTLVPLEGPLSSTLFPSTRLSSFVFVLLEPSYLYNTQDLKFYRKEPPLQRTALPARLAPLASGGNPVGSYHTLRVP